MQREFLYTTKLPCAYKELKKKFYLNSQIFQPAAIMRTEIISQIGQSIDIVERYESQLVQEAVLVQHTSSGLFGYTFPLVFEFSGRATQVGDVTLFSSREVVFSRIMVSLYFLVGNALIKTTFLIILFLMAFRRLLTEPLTDLTQQIEELELDNLEGARVSICIDALARCAHAHM